MEDPAGAPRPIDRSRLVLLSGIAAALITIASAILFALLYADCSEIGCFAIFYFVPVAFVGSVLAAFIAGASARQGCAGYAVALAGAGVGFLAGLYLPNFVISLFQGIL